MDERNRISLGGLGSRDATSRDGRVGRSLALPSFARSGDALVVVWDSLVYIKTSRDESVPDLSSLPHATYLVLLD